jgi:hypothetical protein
MGVPQPARRAAAPKPTANENPAFITLIIIHQGRRRNRGKYSTEPDRLSDGHEGHGAHNKQRDKELEEICSHTPSFPFVWPQIYENHKTEARCGESI